METEDHHQCVCALYLCVCVLQALSNIYTTHFPSTSSPLPTSFTHQVICLVPVYLTFWFFFMLHALCTVCPVCPACPSSHSDHPTGESMHSLTVPFHEYYTQLFILCIWFGLLESLFSIYKTILLSSFSHEPLML